MDKGQCQAQLLGMTAKPFPARSPAEKIGGLVYFGRMLDKIRAHAKGELPAEYVEKLGSGFDGRCVRFLGIDRDPAREHCRLLHLCREGTDVVNAGKISNLTNLLEADLNFVVRNDRSNKNAGRRLLEFFPDLIDQAQLFEQADHVDTAWARRIADRLGCQERFH